MRTLLVGALVAAAVTVGCAGDDAKDASPTLVPPATTPAATQVRTSTPVPPTAAPAGRWDGSAVYLADNEILQSACGREAFALNPSIDGGQGTCILQAMAESNAGQPAMEFFRETSQFLTTFEEAGSVDFGAASAPWFNMSRPSPIFLNAQPDILGVSQVVPAVWEQDERYAAIVQRALDVYGERIGVWAEYARITSLGNEEFLVSYPLQSCRACAIRARLEVRLTFDTDGVLIDQAVLPPVVG